MKVEIRGEAICLVPENSFERDWVKSNEGFEYLGIVRFDSIIEGLDPILLLTKTKE